MKTVLITGGAGQVGREMARLDWGAHVRALFPDRSVLDIADHRSVSAFFAAHAADAIVNTAAFTAVDKAEDEAGEAFAANALAPALLADVARTANIPLIHVSTDYVFSGDKAGPYGEDDPVGPKGVYGASKLAGELALRAAAPRHVIVRTAWVISAHRTNFLKTMLRLAETRPAVSVVADQVGCPTAAGDIAQVLQTIVTAHLVSDHAPTGVYHFANAGEASWCDLANAIFTAAGGGVPIASALPITTEQYPTKARRPANSRLLTRKIQRDFGVNPRPWRDAVGDIIAELRSAETSGAAI